MMLLQQVVSKQCLFTSFPHLQPTQVSLLSEVRRLAQQCYVLITYLIRKVYGHYDNVKMLLNVIFCN